jgi:hypothetical protein
MVASVGITFLHFSFLNFILALPKNVTIILHKRKNKMPTRRKAADVELSPGRKAQKTARWARTMTKWHIKFSGGAKTQWKFVEFGGVNGSESRGIVDILAIRKNHKKQGDGLKRGDAFEMILIQCKGGAAPFPVKEDVNRLVRVAKLYDAKATVLAEWKKGIKLQLYRLVKKEWQPATPFEIFS